MLELNIGHEVVVEEGREVRFEFQTEYVLKLEHSLASLSKWESIWEKPFIDGDSKSGPEIVSYIQCMIQDSNYPEDALTKLTQQNYAAVDAYINKKATATWFNEHSPPAKSSEKITSELIYFWLSGIPSPPPDYEHWHLNRLFTYIKVHDVKNSPKKKMNHRENIESRRELNERRKAELGTRG